ncbi:aspartyl protease [Luteimonas cucumeris]|uniref:Aspartyl protease n=1 Tax=Luteimonas cucumeris TaxID=985012 RepID=A0A562L0P1_9GAMM|nr:retropepsin-like aspartic protease [Luteimonas cucumeris]TWI01086.1 aspartyl protease [Luteimonas cucumeris]
MNELADFLTARGYLRVPLTRSGVGHFHTAGTLNGRPVEVLVDTGAACTVVAMSVVEALGLPSEWLDGEAGGAGGALDQYRVDGAELRLGSFIPQLAGPVGLDFEQVNAPLRAQGSTEVDVILGVDVFDAHAAVIDYVSQSLFLREVASKLDAAATDTHSNSTNRSTTGQ